MKELFGLALLLPLLDAALHWNVLPAASQVLIYLMLAQGLNLVVGMAGLLHLGYAAFLAVGAFSMAYLTSPQSPLHLELPFYLGLPGSVLITAAVGALLAWPVLRLRGDYLAIVTMGFGLMIDPLLRQFDDTTKAITGMSGVATPFAGQPPAGWYYLLLAALLLTVGLAHRVRHSGLGRALRAMREDAIAAEACGVSLARTKLQVLTLAAAVAGLAGALFASYMYTLNLSFPLDFNGSIMMLAMVILGGAGCIRGAVIGGLALGGLNLVVIPKAIDWTNVQLRPLLAGTLARAPWLDEWLDLSKAQFLLFGLTLVGIMLWRPTGLDPEKPVDYT